MPEQLTRHPDVTLQVLRSAGARCGEGLPQQILKTCPRERFCQLPGGEICVYGLDGAAAMTQITPADWQSLGPLAKASKDDAPSMAVVMAAAIGLLVGLLVAALLSRWRSGRWHQ
ncbi:hypothetical protein [Cupriavidus necator]|uniref:hypothetical protein n=1 Tax=Cupriavidus necator TaxID=106590 RepID=UPI00339D3F35